MNYKPKPLDTSKVILTTEHLKLTELLAENTHELWAQQRIAQGWQYGLQRDDNRKEHPCLVPYEDLPESEKQYDRIIALEILKALLTLGYRIEADGTISQTPDSAEDINLQRVLQILKNPLEINLNSMLVLRRQTIGIKTCSPEIYRVLGNHILQLGEPLIAYDVLAEGLQHWPNNVPLLQLQALALARGGATHRANSLLLQLLDSGQSDEKTLGILARTHKDLWMQATEPLERLRHLRLAADRYQQAYQCSGSHWAGINAATMATLMGEEELARSLAREVRERCLYLLNQQSNNDEDKYWLLATLGEAALILREWAQAEDWYGQAAQLGKGQFGNLSSTRRNATRLIQYLKTDKIHIEKLFHLPHVVVFSGHMIDRPDRNTLRFPPQIASIIYQQIRARLNKLETPLGYASAACGSDILFLEAILELNGEVHIVLPYDKEQFVKDSVDIIPGANWVKRFERLIERATEVIVASPRKLEETNVLYEYTNRLVHGLAKIRAEQLETELVPLAVWNGKPGDGLGGTASAVEHWRSYGYDVEIIDLESILQQERLELSPSSNPNYVSPLNSEVSRQIMALLFADVVKYSHLTETQIAPFVEHFLGGIADLAIKLGHEPVVKNTWGDALYYVFKNVREAGKFALDICDFVQNTNWEEKGLPDNLNLRIALHAGPVYRHLDPITRQISYIGTHVSHTARIEPITPPGKVYSSREFAALAATERIRDFACDYVGQTPLAKGYGTFPTYHVHR